MPPALTEGKINYRVKWITDHLLDPTAVHKVDRNKMLVRLGLRVVGEGELPKKASLRDLPPEERMDALYQKVYDAFEGGLDSSNAQMVGRVLDHIKEEKKQQALSGNITINICPWYIPDHVPDQLHEKAFEGVEIDGMHLGPSQWNTIPDVKQLAKAIQVHAERSDKPFGEFLTTLQEALEYA